MFSSLKINNEWKYFQVSAWKYYFNLDPESNKSFKSPFRIDNESGCSFFVYDNIFYMHDFAKRIKYTIIHALMAKHRIDGKAALKLIYQCDKDIETTFELKEKTEFIIRKIPNAKFLDFSLVMTKEWDISKFSKVAINGYMINQEGYCYEYPSGNRKIYFPGNADNKWFTNTDKNDIDGIKIPNNGLVGVTSSRKDCMTLALIGIHAVSPPTEAVILEGNYSFVFYDYDATGIEQANKYKIKTIFTNDRMYKDPYDYYKAYGLNKLKDLCSSILEK